MGGCVTAPGSACPLADHLLFTKGYTGVCTLLQDDSLKRQKKCTCANVLDMFIGAISPSGAVVPAESSSTSKPRS